MGQQVAREVHLFVGEGVVEVALELLEGDLVAALESAVLLGSLLDGVVGEVDIPSREVVQRKLLARRAQITVVVKVSLNLRVY